MCCVYSFRGPHISVDSLLWVVLRSLMPHESLWQVKFLFEQAFIFVVMKKLCLVRYTLKGVQVGQLSHCWPSTIGCAGLKACVSKADRQVPMQGEAPRAAPQGPPDGVAMHAQAAHTAAALPMLPKLAHRTGGWEALPQSTAAGHARQDKAPAACQILAGDADQEADENDWDAI